MRKFLVNIVVDIQLVVLIVLWLLFYLLDFISVFLNRICYSIKVLAEAIKADAIEKCKKFGF